MVCAVLLMSFFPNVPLASWLTVDVVRHCYSMGWVPRICVRNLHYYLDWERLGPDSHRVGGDI